jgi:hypothetical protein
MRNILLAAAAAFVIGGATVGSMMSYAQPAQPPLHGPAAMGSDGWRQHGPMPWMHRPWPGHRLIAPGSLALIYHHPDRNLTPADVQTIAQAFLVWNGNHQWKVVDVKQASGGAIDFALATAQNAVIARFAMNPHTGDLTRTE